MASQQETESQAVKQARAMLIKGDVFYKVSNRSRFSSKKRLNQRYLWVTNDLRYIHWCNGGMKQEGKAKLKKSIKVNEMVCAAVHSNEPTHFEIITHDPKRSIVLRHTDRGRWIKLLNMLKDGRLNYSLSWSKRDINTILLVSKQGCNRRVICEYLFVANAAENWPW